MPPVDESNDARTQYVFVDDSVILTDAWQLRASITHKKLHVFNTSNELIQNLENFGKSTVFYIDSDLNENIKGEEVAHQLFQLGYNNLYLATGSPTTRFQPFSWIKKIVGKECPF